VAHLSWLPNQAVIMNARSVNNSRFAPSWLEFFLQISETEEQRFQNDWKPQSMEVFAAKDCKAPVVK
jgi:hypothetical protein